MVMQNLSEDALFVQCKTSQQREAPLGAESESSAATKIQAMHRGKRQRATEIRDKPRRRGQQKSKVEPTDSSAATKIQSIQRGKQQRRAQQQSNATSKVEPTDSSAATKIQSIQRGKQQRRAQQQSNATPLVSRDDDDGDDGDDGDAGDVCARVSSKLVDGVFKGFQQKVGSSYSPRMSKWKQEDPPPEIATMKEIEEVKVRKGGSIIPVLY